LASCRQLERRREHGVAQHLPLLGQQVGELCRHWCYWQTERACCFFVFLSYTMRLPKSIHLPSVTTPVAPFPLLQCLLPRSWTASSVPENLELLPT
jgi:hypothetical protein